MVALGWGGGGANSCLPHISPHTFPPAVNVSAGRPITLECWADADPAPQFYWVTPTGDKVGGGRESRRCDVTDRKRKLTLICSYLLR